MGYFMDKDVLLKEAERLGLTEQLEGLTWPQQNKLVRDALTERGEIHRAEPQEPVLVPSKYAQAAHRVRTIKDYRNKIVLVAPELKQTPIQLAKYEEDLGEEPMVEDSNVMDDWNMGKPLQKDLVTGTHYITGTTGRRVVAQSTLPKENAEITFRPTVDLVPVVKFQERRGYLFTHHRLPNIKALLIACGHYEEYRKTFSEPPYVFYLTGLLCCDIDAAHQIFDRIEREEKRKAKDE